MAKDLYFTPSGDITVASNGDIAVTTSDIEQIEQQALVRLVTQINDFTVYPNLGASLQRLIGMPNNQRTADYGISLIINALKRNWNIGSVSVDAWPTSPSTIRFEVHIQYGMENSIVLTIDQVLKQ